MKPVRVLIVEDSAVVREHLRRIISADSRLLVAGIAKSGEEALEIVDEVAPDVISMDIRLPGMEGFETTRRIMAQRPTPIVVVSGIGEAGLTMQALRAGALAVIEKPVSQVHDDFEAMAARLCTQLVIMSEVKVIRRRENGIVRRDGIRSDYKRPAESFPPPKSGNTPFRLLAIGASTGGPNALLQVLTGLNEDFPLPIVIVQHMNPGFMEGFAEWLGGATPFSASVVVAPTALARGNIYIAASDQHLLVEGATALPGNGPITGGHRPAANVLFSSVARGFGSAALGVLLTGMGEDGAIGLGELKTAGGYTIAEDESTAVVYGMPAAAVRRGAVVESLPLYRIAPRVLDLIASRKENAG